MPPLTSLTTRLHALIVLVVFVVVGPAPIPVAATPALGVRAEPFVAHPSPPRESPDPVGVWPLDPVPEVVADFDPPSSPWGAGHRGVDLLGTHGQPVRSALPGRISFAGVLAGRGVMVVDHGATRTTYEPVAGSREVGESVAAGAVIGTLQLGGSHCFPRACLHWGWLKGETYLDPLRLVGMGPVRLLPLWRDDPVSARVFGPLWLPPVLPYSFWRPPVWIGPEDQARGCACW